MASFGLGPTYAPTVHNHDAPATEYEIERDRVRQGKCPKCGIETCFWKKSILGGRTLKAHTNGHVFNGRCLICQPISNSISNLIANPVANSIGNVGGRADVHTKIPGYKGNLKGPANPRNVSMISRSVARGHTMWNVVEPSRYAIMCMWAGRDLP